ALRVDDGQIIEQHLDAEAFQTVFDHLWPTDEHRMRDLLLEDDLHGAQHALVLAFGEHDARAFHRGATRGGEYRLHDGAGLVDELLQGLAIRVVVLDRPRGDAGIPGRLRDGGRHVHDEPWIER